MEMDGTLHRNILKVVRNFITENIPFTQSVKLRTTLMLKVDCDKEYEFVALDEINRDDALLCEDDNDEQKAPILATLSGDKVISAEAAEEENKINGISDDKEEYHSDTDELESFEPLPKFTQTKCVDEIVVIQCPVCQLHCDSKRELSKHIKTGHRAYCNDRFKCMLCGKYCLNLDAYVAHFLDKHCDSEGNPLKPNIEISKGGTAKNCKTGKQKGRDESKLKITGTKQPKRKTDRFESKLQVEKDNADSCIAHNHSPEIMNKMEVKNTGNLDKLIKQENSRGSVDCSKCGKTYSSKKALHRHFLVKHENIVYPCEICGKSFNRKESLYHHRRGLHSDEKRFKCTEPGCDAAFNFSHSLKLHLLKHKSSRPYECTTCGKTYLTSHHLKAHIVGTHEQTKAFVCKICGRSFSYSSSLRVHEATHGVTARLKCDKCEKTFVNNQALNYHYMSRHSDPGNFKCDICNKVYNSEVVLKAHKRRHMQDKGRFMCDVCGQQYPHKSALEVHKSIHKDEKNFTCEICNKSFKTYPTLYSHRFVHRKDSPFKCETCGKAFKTKERLRAHSARHSGLKPFECSLCRHCFPDKGGLSKHMKTVHCPVKKFTCDICGKSTTRADNLRVHLKVHAKGNVKPTMTVQDSKDYETDLFPSNVPLVIDVDLDTSSDSKKRRKRRTPNKVTTLPVDTAHDVDAELHVSGDHSTVHSNMPHFSTIDPSQTSSALPGAVSDFVTDSGTASPASGIPAHIANENLVITEMNNSTKIETPACTVKQVPSSPSAGTIFVTPLQPVNYTFPWPHTSSTRMHQGVVPQGYYQP